MCARSLAKRDLFRLPDPFVKITVDSCSGDKNKNKSVLQNGSNHPHQSHSTDVSRNTVDPKWNQHYDLLIGLNDAITISVWNDKKINRDQKGNINSNLSVIYFDIINYYSQLETAITFFVLKQHMYFQITAAAQLATIQRWGPRIIILLH